MVIDTSVILAIFFAEENGKWAAEKLEENTSDLQMSTVNLTETLIRLKDRQPAIFDELEEKILSSGIKFVPVDVEQARIAADARLNYPLNLGDCFVYALAKTLNRPILTLDSDFTKLDWEVVLPR